MKSYTSFNKPAATNGVPTQTVWMAYPAIAGLIDDEAVRTLLVSPAAAVLSDSSTIAIV